MRLYWNGLKLIGELEQLIAGNGRFKDDYSFLGHECEIPVLFQDVFGIKRCANFKFEYLVRVRDDQESRFIKKKDFRERFFRLHIEPINAV